MFKSQYLSLGICYLVIASNAASVSFIDRCKWDDRACLVTSSQKALPFVASGVPELGMTPLDPLNINRITVNEGGLALDFNDVVVTGTKDCKVIDVERNIKDHWLRFSCECPIEVNGKYTAGGDLLSIPVVGDGAFSVKSDKFIIVATADLTETNGADGQKHWKFGKYSHTFEFMEKTLINFENLFNGDQAKAEPVLTIIQASWKPLIDTIGKPLVAKLVDDVIAVLKIFTEAVPASELEL